MCPRNWTRDMFRAITIAQQSLKSYDDCAWDSWSCSNPFSHFRVVWIDDGQSNNTKFHFFPSVVPDLINRVKEHKNLLDTIFRYPTTSVAMVECISSTTHMATAAAVLGVSILCTNTDYNYKCCSHDMMRSYLEESNGGVTRSSDSSLLPMYELRMTKSNGRLDPTDKFYMLSGDERFSLGMV
jgi:hypothetical protein